MSPEISSCLIIFLPDSDAKEQLKRKFKTGAESKPKRSAIPRRIQSSPEVVPRSSFSLFNIDFLDLQDRFIRFIFIWHILHGKGFLIIFGHLIVFTIRLQEIFQVLSQLLLFEVQCRKFIQRLSFKYSLVIDISLLLNSIFNVKKIFKDDEFFRTLLVIWAFH